MIVSPRGQYLTSSTDHQVRVYSGLGARQLYTLQSDSRVRRAFFSGDGSRLVVEKDDGLSIYDTPTGILLRRIPVTARAYYQFNPARADRLLVLGDMGELTIWDVTAGLAQASEVVAFDVSDQGEGMTMSNRGSVRLWSSDAEEVGALNIPERLRAAGLETGVYAGGDLFDSAALSATGTFVAVASPTGTAYVVPLDPKRKPVRLAVREPGDLVTKVTVSPTGRYVAGVYLPATLAGTGSDQADGVTEGEPGEPLVGLYVWDTATGQPLYSVRTDSAGVSSMDFSPDEKELVVLGIRDVLVWNLSSGKFRLTIAPAKSGTQSTATGAPSDGAARDGQARETTFVAVAWSPDGRLLVTAQNDVLQLRDAHSGQEVGKSLGPHGGWILDAAFDIKGAQMVSTHEDQTVVVWNINSREALRIADHRQFVRWAKFAGPKRLLVLDDTGIPSVVWLDSKDLLDAAKTRATHELTYDECMRYLNEAQICSSD